MTLSEKWDLMTYPERRLVLSCAGLQPRVAGYRLGQSYEQLEDDPKNFINIKRAIELHELDDRVRLGDYIKIVEMPKKLRPEVTDPKSEFYINPSMVQRVRWVDNDGTSIEVGLYERLKLGQYEKANEPKMVYTLRRKSVYNQFGDRILRFEYNDKELMRKVVDAMNQ